MIGRTLDSRYRIDQLVGTESPAELYLASEEGSDATIFVWVLRSESGMSLMKAEFLAAARQVQRVQNDRIPRVLDTGEDSDSAFVVVERVEGAGLDQVVKGRGRMPVDEAVGLTYQVLRALQSAASVGIAHGRIEPRRLVLKEDGLLKLTGLELSGLWRYSQVTSAYAPPEIKNGHRPDVRADLFSLGVVLYELLSGRLPFSEEDQDARPTPLRYLRPDAPKELEALLDRTLDADPDQRPQSTEDMERALEAAIQGKPYELAGPINTIPREPEVVPASAENPAESTGTQTPAVKESAVLPSQTRRRRMWPMVGVAITTLVVVGGFGWFSMFNGATMLGLAAAAAHTAAPTPPPPTAVPTTLPTTVPPTAVPTSQPTSTPVPAVHLLKTSQEKDPVGREWWVSQWSDGTTTRVEIVPAPELSSFSARAGGIRMFESGADGLPLGKRQYATRFAKASTRFVNYELDLSYPDPRHTVNFTLRAFYYDSTGRLIVIQAQNAHVEGGWTQSYHWNGYGWPDSGHWQAGKYRLDLYDGTVKLGSVNFEIY